MTKPTTIDILRTAPPRLRKIIRAHRAEYLRTIRRAYGAQRAREIWREDIDQSLWAARMNSLVFVR